jgi:hypothetical protein
MNDDNEIIKGMNALDMQTGHKGQAEIKAAICMNGFNVAAFRSVVRSLSAGKDKWTTIKASDLIQAYENKVEATQSVSIGCQYCHSSGWLKPVLIEGKYLGYTKVYQVNFYKPEKSFKFVAANPSFLAFAGLLPCVCENGTPHNTKFDQEWMTMEQRQRATGYSVHIGGEAGPAGEDYYQGELIRCLNLAASGQEYKSRQLKDWPQDIEEIKKQLVKALSEVAT